MFFQFFNDFIFSTHIKPKPEPQQSNQISDVTRHS